MSRTQITVRALEPDDLAAVIAIDERMTGDRRAEYWAKRLELSTLRPPWMSLVAEVDNRVVGFLFGWVSGWEFGIPGEAGWIDMIGVDPPYRGQRVGAALVERFVAAAESLRGIKKVFTLVHPEQAGIPEFFGALGFQRGKMVQMEKTLG